ncbi:MAG: HlyD family efflux transporter periplasmic adaptor subunit [Pseudomonadota bacterium]
MAALRRFRTGAALVVLLALAAVLVYGRSQDSRARAREVQVAEAMIRDFNVQVTTIGVLDTARSHMLSSEIKSNDGKILYIVDDGTHVKAGDLLVTIDSAPFEEKIQTLEADVTAIESGVKAKEQVLELEKNSVEKNISSGEFALTVAQLELRRLVDGEGPLQISQFSVEAAKARQEYEKYLTYCNDLKGLSQKGFSTEGEVSQVESMLGDLKEKWESADKKLSIYTDHVFPSLKQAAEATVEKAEMDILQVKNAGIFSIAKAVADLEESRGRLMTTRAQLKQAQDELYLTRIKAPSDGIAILFETYRDGEKRKPRVGDRALRNQPLLYLPDIASMIVKTRVREVDLHKISLNQKAMVRVDAYPDLDLEGRVDFIGALAAEMNADGMGGKYFQLTVALTRQEMRLRPGMTARVTIVSDQVRNALTVPVSAVFQDHDGWICYRRQGKAFMPVPVIPGRQNLDFIEITSGLKAGDEVALVKPEDSALVPYSGQKG